MYTHKCTNINMHIHKGIRRSTTDFVLCEFIYAHLKMHLNWHTLY